MNLKINGLISSLIILMVIQSCSSESYRITFQLDMNMSATSEVVGIRGNVAPLSWDTTYPLTDEDGDGIYETDIVFKTDKKNLGYKYINGAELELSGSDNRILWFKKDSQSVKQIFNEFDYYKTAKPILTYSQDQVDEDISTMVRALEVIHPNLYKYQSKQEFEQSVIELREEVNLGPTLSTMYAAVSKFAAKIKCSHTFTNPWNQGPDIERLSFYQPDKIPFTFNRIGKRLFIDKNASQRDELKKGIEVLSINNIDTEEIFKTLTSYITSDGDNYEKRLQRLTLSGDAKFELFDIFLSLEYGSRQVHRLELYDQVTNQVKVVDVKALSKTARTAVLNKRYGSNYDSFESGWEFKMIDHQTAYLKMHSFAIFNTDFDWKKFLDNGFKKMRSEEIEHLIIDIRGNEGGDAAVALYVLERIIKSPIKVNGSTSVSAYRTIPDDLRNYISTWDDRPYDWGKKVQKIADGRYKLKDKFEEKGKTFKPKKTGFKGQSYLLVDATNSSATHLMASYVKEFNLATIVGQETGGNQKGLNGGYMFFFRMPNSRVELDIPVFGINVRPDTDETYNGGIKPDIYVQKNVDDLKRGIDTELESTLKMINERE